METEATSSEKSVLLVLLQRPRAAIAMDIHTLAKTAGTSASTIIRICQKNGLKGYRELKQAIQNDLYSFQKSETILRTEPDKNENTIIYQLYREEIQALESTYHLNSPDMLRKAVSMIQKSSVICLFGIGSSQLVARDFQMKLERIGRMSVLYEDFHMQALAASNIRSKDLAVFFSYSGETSELKPMIEECRKNQASILGITQLRSSTLSASADLCLYVPAIEKPLRPGASSSRICMLSIVDLLYALLLPSLEEDVYDHILKTKIMMEKEGYQ